MKEGSFCIRFWMLHVDDTNLLHDPMMKDIRPKVSLVLDLDETLVHASLEKPEIYDFELHVPSNTGDVVIYVQHRPGVIEFINSVIWEFDVFIFTASVAEYAVPVVQHILPCFPSERILCRPYCRRLGGFLVKDLTIFQRDLSRMIMVDNSPESFLLQKENGLLVTSSQKETN